MNREGLSKLKFVNLFIAFAIAWLSLSSIIDFHIHKIYKKDIFGKIEFIKTDSKKSIAFVVNTSHEPDLKADINCSFGDALQVKYQIIEKEYQLTPLSNYHQYIGSNGYLRGPPVFMAS